MFHKQIRRRFWYLRLEMTLIGIFSYLNGMLFKVFSEYLIVIFGRIKSIIFGKERILFVFKVF